MTKTSGPSLGGEGVQDVEAWQVPDKSRGVLERSTSDDSLYDKQADWLLGAILGARCLCVCVHTRGRALVHACARVPMLCRGCVCVCVCVDVCVWACVCMHRGLCLFCRSTLHSGNVSAPMSIHCIMHACTKLHAMPVCVSMCMGSALGRPQKARPHVLRMLRLHTRQRPDTFGSHLVCA